MIVGVTGKSGSGKSSYCEEQARQLNGVHIDVDEYCRDSLERHKAEVCAAFGLPETATRREIGERAFLDRDKYSEMRDLVWPDAEKAILEEIARCRADGVDALVDFILLPKSKALMDACDATVLVEASQESRKARILKRDGVSEEYFFLREASSMEYDGIEFDHVETT